MLDACRAGFRLAGFVALCVAELMEWLTVVALFGRAKCHQARAEWLSRFCQRLVRLFGVEVEVSGRPPADGLLVCNHLSYLDIVVLVAQAPTIFLSKSEVRNWPGLGVLVQCAGTLFVDRERRSDVARAGAELGAALKSGTPVCMFPEGTSSDGTRVLPFRSSLLAPAIDHDCRVNPVWIGYELEEGSVEEEVCYWGDMSFGPHFLNLLGKRRIYARVRYGTPQSPGDDRKALAAALHDEVSRLGRCEGSALQIA